jgi:multiple sugar transport system permease protein
MTTWYRAPAAMPAVHRALAGARPGRLRALTPYLLLLPVLAFISVFVFRPVVHAAFLSTVDWHLGSGPKVFVGLENFARLLRAPEFWNALRNTAVYAGSVGGLSIAIGLGLALALRQAARLVPLWQSVYFLPVCATMAAMAVVWQFMFHADIGVLNAILQGVGLPAQSWLTRDLTAMIAVVAVGVWSGTGYAMVLFLAGLTAIPRDLHEAAAVDGARPLDQFRWITWPLLMPTTLFVVVIMTIRSMEAFDAVRILTNGGPLGATQVLSHLLYEEGFQFFDTGYASSVAVVFFLLLLALAWAQVRIIERRVHYR